MRRTIAAITLSTIFVVSCSAPAAAPSPPGAGSSSAAPSASAAAMTAWELVKIPPAVSGGFTTPSAVAAGAGRLVAVGGVVRTNADNEGPNYGAVWTSEDGLSWMPTGLAPDLEIGTSFQTSGPGPGLFDVAYGPGGFVALGYTGFPNDGIKVGLWRSAEGLTWDRVEMDPGLFAGARPAALQPGGPGYVIVGAVHDTSGTLAESLPPRAAAWTSPDGLAWTRVPDQEAFAIGGYIDTGEMANAGGILDVVDTGQSLMAVGQQCGEDTAVISMGTNAPCRPMIWTSPDAQTWTKVDPEVGAHPGVVSSIATTASASQVVAVGGGWDHPTAARYVLRSTDGTSWTWSEDPMQTRFSRILSVPGGFVATSDAAGRLGLWRSNDGIEWQPIPNVQPVPFLTGTGGSDLAVSDGNLVVVGWHELPESSDSGGFALVGPLELVTPGGD